VFITSILDGTFQKDVKMIGYQILKDIGRVWFGFFLASFSEKLAVGKS
jgi:hypothetical protein